jgi:hypothetical protein
LSQFGTLFTGVNLIRKPLKTIAFIYENSLDTPVFRLIRFPQKVLTEFKPPLELFSLEEKVALLPGGLFVSAQPFRRKRLLIFKRNCFIVAA